MTPAEPLADGEMVEKVARAIDPDVWTLFDDYAEAKRWSREEREQEIFERINLSTSSLGKSIHRARAAIAAYNPNDRLREALERDELVREAMFVLSDRLRASGILSASDAVHEAYEAVVAALSHKD